MEGQMGRRGWKDIMGRRGWKDIWGGGDGRTGLGGGQSDAHTDHYASEAGG